MTEKLRIIWKWKMNAKNVTTHSVFKTRELLNTSLTWTAVPAIDNLYTNLFKRSFKETISHLPHKDIDLIKQEAYGPKRTPEKQFLSINTFAQSNYYDITLRE